MYKLLSVILLFVLSFSADAQFVKRVKNAAKQSAENKATQKTAETVDKGVDKTFDAAKGIFKKKENADSSNIDNSSYNDVIQDTGIEAVAEMKMADDTTGTEFGVYSNFTFVPGNKLLFYDDFATDAIGDFPAQWETGGSGEVVQLSNNPDKWLSINRRSGYLPVMDKTLPENYTIEFDFLTNGYGKGKPISKVFFAFLSKKAYNMGRGGTIADLELLLSSFLNVRNVENFGSDVTVKIGNGIDRELPEAINTKVHFSIAVNKKRLRIWLNEEKYVDAPNIIQANIGKYFIIEARDVLPEKGHFVGITNFRIAESTDDLRTTLLANGKFSTTGIYFNTNSAVVKKESYGVIKSVADMLAADPNMKLRIVGHTDAQGADALNLELSQRRAASVKNILSTQFGIADNRLETAGKGEAEPVDDNTTEKGKANNRRVEFIKNKL